MQRPSGCRTGRGGTEACEGGYEDLWRLIIITLAWLTGFTEETEEAAAEEEDDAPKEEKPKSKLDLLPPSPLSMDEWKRTYSNQDTKTVAVPWFLEHFDPQGFSIWFAEYKFNSELGKVFQASNAISGFLQRLDKLRKYGFGSILLFGQEGGLSISAFWLFRGTEVPDEVRCRFIINFLFFFFDYLSFVTSTSRSYALVLSLYRLWDFTLKTRSLTFCLFAHFR